MYQFVMQSSLLCSDLFEYFICLAVNVIKIEFCVPVGGENVADDDMGRC